MKLIVFSKKTLFSCSFIFFNTKLTKKVLKNLIIVSKLFLSYNTENYLSNLNSIYFSKFTFFVTKSNYLFFFILKQMLFFFIFRKKYLYINSYENFCFWKSNLNKFSKIDLVFLLNYIFELNFTLLTKPFFQFFKFLRFFSYNYLPSKKIYRRKSRWFSNIFFKRISTTLQNITKKSNKTVFSFIYWSFVLKNYFSKKKICKNNNYYKVDTVMNDYLFNFKITLFCSHQNVKIGYKFFNKILFWQNTLIVKLQKTQTIMWFFHINNLIRFNYINFLKSLTFNVFCKLVFKEFFFFYSFEWFYFNEKIDDYDESIKTANFVDALEDLYITGIDLSAMYARIDKKFASEFNKETLNNVYDSLKNDPYNLIDESEVDIFDTIEGFKVYQHKEFDVFKHDSKNYFFNWKRSFLQNTFGLNLTKHLNSIFNSSLSLNLFLLFFLTSYTSPFVYHKNVLEALSYQISFNFTKAQNFNNYLYYNNVYPMFLFPPKIVNVFKKKQEAIIDEELSLFFRHHLGGFLEFFTNRKIFVRIVSRLKISSDILLWIKQIVQTHTAFQKLLGKGFFLEEMIFILWQSFFQKDLDFLVTWVQRTMKKIELPKHKNFIKVFKFILLKYWFFFCKTTQILGFRFEIRGKIGVTGNAKKKNTGFFFGSSGFSKKKHRLELRQGLVNTETGILGLTFILAF